jgi:hypothetical protein
VVCLSVIVKPRQWRGEQDRFYPYVLSIIQLYGILFLLADVSYMPVAVFMMAFCLSKSRVCEVDRAFFFFFVYAEGKLEILAC